MIRTLRAILVAVLLAAVMSVVSAAPSTAIGGDVHTKAHSNCISKAYEYSQNVKVTLENNRTSGQCRTRVEWRCNLIGNGQFAGRETVGVVAVNPGGFKTDTEWCQAGEYVAYVDVHQLWVVN